MQRIADMPGRRKLSIRKIGILVGFFFLFSAYHIYGLIGKNNNSVIPIIGSEDGFIFTLRIRSTIELSIMKDTFYEMNFLDLDNMIILEGLSAQGDKYYIVSKNTGKIERVDLEVDNSINNIITAKRKDFVSYNQFLEIQEGRLDYDLSLSNFDEIMALQWLDTLSVSDKRLNRSSYGKDELFNIPFRVNIGNIEPDVYHIDAYLSNDGEPVVFIISQ